MNVIEAIRKAQAQFPGGVFIRSSQPTLESLKGPLPYEVVEDADCPIGYVYVMPKR